MTLAVKNGHHHGGGFRYHPFEITLCGYSGSGKTTLACKLLERWRERYRVGFVKHDAHRFEMDKAGKDTHRATEAGAASVMINDPLHFARISRLPYSQFERAYAFVDADFVLAEGYKRSDLPKLLVLDGEGKALGEYREGRFTRVQALIGPDEAPDGLPEDVPFFHRDDVVAIGDFIEAFMRRRAEAPLYGLVLIGGKSTRMGRPKWKIRYAEKPQAHRMTELLGDVCGRVFLSARTDQQNEELPEAPVIEDSFPAWGPTTGILSAMTVHPEAAWLVVACDLPFLDEATLSNLAEQRDPLKVATAYRSANDGLPEPLCAIWEPRAKQRLMQAAGIGLTCPRKVLIESRPKLLELAEPRALENANTPEDFEEAREALRAQTEEG